MSASRHFSAAWLGVGFGLLLAAAECWLVFASHNELRRAALLLDKKRMERDTLAVASPAPTAENALAMAVDADRAARALEECKVSARAGAIRLGAESPPLRAIDAYADLAAFRAECREEAARGHVKVKPDQSFGFGAYVAEGPDVTVIPAVFRQRQILRVLVAALIESGPHELLEVRRERPVVSGETTGNAGPRAPGLLPTATERTESGNDFFVPEEQRLGRKRWHLESAVFRLQFSGDTAVLREFLNRLAQGVMPALVQSIEVEPMTESSQDRSAGGIESVARRSRFTVTIEVPVSGDFGAFPST